MSEKYSLSERFHHVQKTLPPYIAQARSHSSSPVAETGRYEIQKRPVNRLQKVDRSAARRLPISLLMVMSVGAGGSLVSLRLFLRVLGRGQRPVGNVCERACRAAAHRTAQRDFCLVLRAVIWETCNRNAPGVRVKKQE